MSGEAQGMRRFLADTTAMVVFSTVAGMFTEIVVAGLSVQQSLYARLTALPIILITARPYGRYRDWMPLLSCRGGSSAPSHRRYDGAHFVPATALLDHPRRRRRDALADRGSFGNRDRHPECVGPSLRRDARPLSEAVRRYAARGTARAQLSACDSRARIVRSA